MTIPEPINILKEFTSAPNLKLKNELLDILKSVYRYEIFKPIMDLSTTLAYHRRLKFVAEPKEFYTLDEGNCVTIEGGTFDKFTNLFTSSKKYKITIKKLSSHVTTHEIGHMVEKEMSLSLNHDFMQMVYADISIKHSQNPSLNSAIKRIMIEEVNHYNRNNQPSELFARFFQLLAMTKEIAGFSAEYGFKIEDLYKAFPNYHKWLITILYPQINEKINLSIASQSRAYTVPIEMTDPQWSNEKIKPIHSTSNLKNSSNWSSHIKSIKN